MQAITVKTTERRETENNVRKTAFLKKVSARIPKTSQHKVNYKVFVSYLQAGSDFYSLHFVLTLYNQTSNKLQGKRILNRYSMQSIKQINMALFTQRKRTLLKYSISKYLEAKKYILKF